MGLSAEVSPSSCSSSSGSSSSRSCSSSSSSSSRSSSRLSGEPSPSSTRHNGPSHATDQVQLSLRPFQGQTPEMNNSYLIYSKLSFKCNHGSSTLRSMLLSKLVSKNPEDPSNGQRPCQDRFPFYPNIHLFSGTLFALVARADSDKLCDGKMGLIES